MNRKEKTALLCSIVSGTATPKQIDTLRKSAEPIKLTFILDKDNPNPQPVYPTFHMDIYEDCRLNRSYYRYEDGRIEEVNKYDRRSA